MRKPECPAPAKIGEVIRYHRMAIKMSQRALAASARVDITNLCKLEKGFAVPFSSAAVSRIAEAIHPGESEFRDDLLRRRGVLPRGFAAAIIADVRLWREVAAAAERLEAKP